MVYIDFHCHLNDHSKHSAFKKKWKNLYFRNSFRSFKTVLRKPCWVVMVACFEYFIKDSWATVKTWKILFDTRLLLLYLSSVVLNEHIFSHDK